MARKTGARGLRGIMEKIMTNIMFELPSRTDVIGCRITRQTVEQEQEPMLILREQELPGPASETDAGSNDSTALSPKAETA